MHVEWCTASSSIALPPAALPRLHAVHTVTGVLFAIEATHACGVVPGEVQPRCAACYLMSHNRAVTRAAAC